MSFSGACAIWAIKNNDYTPTFYPGTNAGLVAAIAYAASAGADGGFVMMYPGGSGSVSIPTIPANVELQVKQKGRTFRYGPGGLINRRRNVRDFGAIGDGSADDTAAFVAAHADLDTNGGEIYLPAGDYRLSSKVTFTKRVHMTGSGTHEPDPTSTAPCRIIKKNTGSSYALIEFQGHGSSVENIVFHGEAGNAGDGVYATGQRFLAKNVIIEQMGGVGLSIGRATNDANLFSLFHVECAHNGSHGCEIGSDDGGGGPNTNAGTAIGLSCQSNTGKGLRLYEGSKNTFIGFHAEANGEEGLYITGNSDKNTFMGGDLEGNSTIAGNSVEVRIASGSSNDNWLINVGNQGIIVRAAAGTVDDGALNDRTMIIQPGMISMPQGANAGEVFSNRPTGVSLSGSNAAWISFWGDALDRLRIGIKADGPDTSANAFAQIFAQPSNNQLHVASRNGGTVKLRSGNNLVGYLLLDTPNGVCETTEILRTLKHAELTKISTPANPASGTCRIYGKDNAGKFELRVRFADGTDTLMFSSAGAA